ncbi:hypothetical protein AB4212_47445 [Streptomyces sp. 2MCAF27]
MTWTTAPGGAPSILLAEAEQEGDAEQAGAVDGQVGFGGRDAVRR